MPMLLLAQSENWFDGSQPLPLVYIQSFFLLTISANHLYQITIQTKDSFTRHIYHRLFSYLCQYQIISGLGSFFNQFLVSSFSINFYSVVGIALRNPNILLGRYYGYDGEIIWSLIFVTLANHIHNFDIFRPGQNAKPLPRLHFIFKDSQSIALPPLHWPFQDTANPHFSWKFILWLITQK